MSGWRKTVAPPRYVTWADEVVALYQRDASMGADEFERLLDVAMRGERPDHSKLPAYLPFPAGPWR